MINRKNVIFDISRQHMAVGKNELLFYGENICVNTALIAGSGTIFNSFLIHSGIADSRIGLYSTIVQLTQVFVMLASTGFVDRVKNVRRLYAFSIGIQSVFYALMFVMSSSFARADTLFTAVTVGGIFVNLAIGLRTVITYKLPYIILDMKKYGRITVTECLLVSVFGMVLSFAANRAFESRPFDNVMRALFFIGCILMLAACMCVLAMQTDTSKIPKQQPKANTLRVLRDRRFYIFALPNVFRGFAAGVISMVVIFAKDAIHAEPEVISGILTRFAFIGQIASLVSYCLYRFISGHVKAKNICLAGCIIFALMPLMGILHNSMLYMAVYFIVYIGMGLFAVAIPVIVAENIGFEIAGTYTALRMLLTTAGTALGTYVSGIVAERSSSLVLFTIAAILQVICGIAYLRFDAVSHKNCV